MMLDWKNIQRPIIALSPMADMTDSAFCRAVRFTMKPTGPIGPIEPSAPRPIAQPSRQPNLIVFREMVSAEAVMRRNNKTLDMTEIHQDERPIVQQLFGSDPDIMAEAARIIEEEHHPEGFDVNMGCPVYKIVHNFNGAALMKEPKLATRIVQKIKTATSVPLSIKIRAGWEDPNECFEFARVLETAGADMITIHGRTKAQGYTGKSDWDLIGRLKQTLSIPLLANGDIHSPPLAIEALETTKADGVLIARGALGNPWIFKQIEDLLAQRQPQAITLEERIRVVKQHLAFHIEQYGPRGVVTFRKHLSWYFRGINGAKRFKLRLHTTSSVDEVQSILDEMLIDGLQDNALSNRDAAHPLANVRMYMAK